MGAVLDPAPLPSSAMSLGSAIPWRVALQQSPPPLHRPESILHPPAETVNHHLAGAGEFSTGELGNFQPALTKDPLEQLMVRFDSWRAARSGNGAGRNLATKSTHGGRAIWQAVTRVKLEQASKAAMWTPTRRKIGEGRTDGEEPGAGARIQR